MKLDSIETTVPAVSSHLCDGPGLLAIIWPDEKSRPSLRAFIKWRDQGLIPYIKLGRLVFYDPAEVRWALRKKCTVKAK
jgi:hypothetical protein